MDSRDLISSDEKLEILVDSNTIDEELEDENSTPRKLLRYQQHDYFDFLRTPHSVSHDILDSIEAYNIVEGPDQYDSLEWSGHWEALLHTDDQLELERNRLDSHGAELSEEELRVLGVHATMNRGMPDEDRVLLLTTNNNLLSNRRLIESEFGDTHDIRITIGTPKEIGEIMGLFMRFRDEFKYYPRHDDEMSFEFGLTNWCWSLRDLSVPHIPGGDDKYMAALRNRLENLILGLDELGYQYFHGTGNHTNIRTRYHFDHQISLITGIFDALALHTRDEFGIELQDRETSIRTGEPLFQEINDIDEELWHFIERNHPFVELIYVIRPIVIHREGVMMSGPGFSYREGDNYREWESHAIQMEGLREEDREKFARYYVQLDDDLLDYDPITEWGLFEESSALDQSALASRVRFIEPYQFIKRSLNELLPFVDEYLSLLGHEDRLDMLSESHATRYAQLRNVERHMLSPIL